MGNKTINQANENKNNYIGNSKPHVWMGHIQKKTHEVKGTSHVGKKAKELMKKNFSLFMKTMNHFSNHQPNAFIDYTHSSIELPTSDDESYRSLLSDLKQPYALHMLETWKNLVSYPYLHKSVPVDQLPRTWKETITDLNSLGYSLSQIKYQELIYEIILTEQIFVDDLILVYKIFIKEASQWTGLPSTLRKLFESLFSIIRLHLQLLMALKERQKEQHPCIKSLTDIFKGFLGRIGIYSTYFSTFEKANSIITESIKSKDELGSFFIRRSLWKECRNLPLSAYLLTPIQRVMKYPLFFKSLADCLSSTDPEQKEIKSFLSDIDIMLRYFEEQKKESEDFMKLEDLAGRIGGLEGSTIRLAQPGRKLIFEGYLSLVPETNFSISQASFCSTATDDFSLASAVRSTPTLSRKNSSFSLSSKKLKRTYVFLFNDLIVCTREKSKKKTSPIEHKPTQIPLKKGTFYGPSPDTLFKITHTPGKITLVDRSVMREVIPETKSISRRGSTLLNSFRKYSSSHNLKQLEESLTDYEKHPLQFICSVATKNITNLHFEADTVELKEAWCEALESVLSEHVQREPPVIGQILQSPTQSHYSVESQSSIESQSNINAWTGYCDVEKMEVDEETGSHKEPDFISTIMDEFGDSIWSIDATDLSPFQIKKTFANIGLNSQ